MHIGDNKSSEGWLNHWGVIYIYMHTLEACDQGKHESSDAAEVETRVAQIINPLMINYFQTLQRLECLKQRSPAPLGPATK